MPVSSVASVKVRWMVAVLAACLVTSQASAQATEPAAKPAPVLTQFVGLGLTGLSNSVISDYGPNLFAGFAFNRLYFNLATNIFTSNGVSNATNDYQLGYLFFHHADPKLPNRAGFGITGGYWAAESGGGSPIIAFNGFAAPAKWKITNHIMTGYILPKNGGEGAFLFRFGLGWIF